MYLTKRKCFIGFQVLDYVTERADLYELNKTVSSLF